MEFLSFDSILNLLAAFGLGCLGITLLGRHSVFGLFLMALSAAFIGLSKQTVNLDFVMTASFLPSTLLENSSTLSFAIIIYAFMAANSLRITNSILNIAFIFVFGMVAAQVLQKSGLVVGPYFPMAGLIFATALTCASVFLMTQRQPKVGNRL